MSSVKVQTSTSRSVNGKNKQQFFPKLPRANKKKYNLKLQNMCLASGFQDLRSKFDNVKNYADLVALILLCINIAFCMLCGKTVALQSENGYAPIVQGAFVLTACCKHLVPFFLHFLGSCSNSCQVGEHSPVSSYLIIMFDQLRSVSTLTQLCTST